MYILRSVSKPGQRYFGITSDLKQRLEYHNAGRCPHTSKFMPWKVETYVAFSDERKAFEFEKYLKTGSGREFSRRRFWPAAEKPSYALPSLTLKQGLRRADYVLSSLDWLARRSPCLSASEDRAQSGRGGNQFEPFLKFLLKSKFLYQNRSCFRHLAKQQLL